MLITEPPAARYMFDSKRVENWGPSEKGSRVSILGQEIGGRGRGEERRGEDEPMQTIVPLSCITTPSPASA